MKTTYGKYGTRYWAVWRNEELVAVTIYKKGAMTIVSVILELEQKAEADIDPQRISVAAKRPGRSRLHRMG